MKTEGKEVICVIGILHEEKEKHGTEQIYKPYPMKTYRN